MASSDIIKIGFDYRSSLAQFEKETDGVFNEVEKQGQRIEIKLHADDKDIVKKIDALTKSDFKDITLSFNDKPIKEQSQLLEGLRKQILNIANMFKKGYKIDDIIDSTNAISEINNVTKANTDNIKQTSEIYKKETADFISNTNKKENAIDGLLNKLSQLNKKIKLNNSEKNLYDYNRYDGVELNKTSLNKALQKMPKNGNALKDYMQLTLRDRHGKNREDLLKVMGHFSDNLYEDIDQAAFKDINSKVSKNKALQINQSIQEYVKQWEKGNAEIQKIKEQISTTIDQLMNELDIGHGKGYGESIFQNVGGYLTTISGDSLSIDKILKDPINSLNSLIGSAISEQDKFQNELKETGSQVEKTSEKIKESTSSNSISSNDSQIEELKSDIKDVKTELGDVKDRISNIESNGFENVREDVEKTKESVKELNSELTEMKSNLSSTPTVNESNISNGMKDAIQNADTKLDNTVSTAKELDKTLEKVDIPTDSFDEVLNRLNLAKSELVDIVKITRQSISDSDGKFHNSYTLKDSRGSTEIYGLNSKTDKGQILRQNIVGYDKNSIIKANEQALKEQNKINQEQIKIAKQLSAEKQKAVESDRKSTVNQASKDQLEAWKQIQRIRKAIANTSNDKLVDQLKQEKKTYQEQYLTATKILKNNSDLYNSEQRLNELKKISLKTTQQIESTQQRQLNGYDNKLSGYQGKVSGYTATINKFGDDGWTSPEYLQNVQKAQKALKAYKDEIDRLKANPDLVNKRSLANVEKLGKDFENATLAIKNMTAAQKGYTQLGAEKALDKITQMVKENSKMSRQAKAAIQGWYNQIKSGNPTASLDVILGKVESIVRAEKEAGRGGKSMLDAIKEKAWYGAASAIGTYFGLNDIFRYGREIADTVIQLDTATTELRKVSDATDQRLVTNFENSAKTAKQLGSTISDVISATADWSRMGYNIDQAEELARVSTLYKNVGDGIDIESANNSLISTLQGFQLDASQAESIIDKFNEVANNYAIDSAGIGEALQRSAASFNAANTDLSKSIALITATNEVVQDPDSVGTLWKTMSARIRGAETELSELNEETDEYTKTTSKLRDLIKSLTGFDIMADEDTFKDIYDIILGIGKEWNNLTDAEQSSLGEALAGKRNANALYAVLGNLDTLQSAYETAENSAGSAQREQENYQKSIQYSIDQTKAKLEELSNDLLSSDFLKGAIDAGGKLIDILDGIVKSGNAIPAIATAISAALSFKNIGKCYVSA